MKATEEINQWREGKITLKTYTCGPVRQDRLPRALLIAQGARFRDGKDEDARLPSFFSATTEKIYSLYQGQLLWISD